jgi:uncharacterized repeat protein (TIGR01451 family)
VIISAIVISPVLAAQPASAAPGDPFSPADPYVFVAQNSPTQLFRATTGGSGTSTFTAEGAAWTGAYNAIAYRTADNYIYGIVSTAGSGIPAGSLVRIGQGGVVTRVGSTTFTATVSGTFGPADGYLYTYANVGGTVSLQVINVANGTLVRTTAVTNGPLAGADMAFLGGFLWTANAATLTRTNPATGATTRWTNPFVSGEATGDSAGAAWTYGNGNLGFSFNQSGRVYQVAVTNPGAANPTFTTVSRNAGPASGQNDGTASPGQPTDLSVVKIGPTSYVPGKPITYTLTVRNNGAGNSSGFALNDAVPSPLTGVTSPNAACTVTGNNVRCVGGRLVAGASVTFTVTANVPASASSNITNTATVTSNETDSVTTNNTSSTTAVPASLGLVKRAGSPVDANGNGVTDVGDTIAFSFDLTNTGDVALSAVAVSDPLAGTVTCPSSSLAVDAMQTCTAAPYTVTADDVTAGRVLNTATATGTTPDNVTVSSAPSSTTTPTEAPAPSIRLVKTADPTDPARFVPGQLVTYTFTVSNTGNVPLDGLTIAETAFTGSGEVSAIECEATALAVGAVTTCEATYTLTAADVDAGSVTNSAVATGTPPGGDPVTSEPSTAIVPILPGPAVSLVKTADVETVAAAGDEVAYSFLVSNAGNVTLTGIVIDETEFSGSGVLSDIACPTTTLAVGEATTCTATYTTTQADIDAGSLLNTATVSGVAPGGEVVVSDPSTVTIAAPPAAAITIVKTADRTMVVRAGEEITYSFLVTNAGNVTLTGATVTETAFSGTGTSPAIVCPAGSTTLSPGATTTCTATYAIVDADMGLGEITNTAVATGFPPTGAAVTSDPSSAVVTVFALSLPLTGGTSADHVVALGGSAMFVAGLLAVWHLRRLRRRQGPDATTTSSFSSTSSSNGCSTSSRTRI